MHSMYTIMKKATIILCFATIIPGPIHSWIARGRSVFKGVGGVVPDVIDLRQKRNIDSSSSVKYRGKISL